MSVELTNIYNPYTDLNNTKSSLKSSGPSQKSGFLSKKSTKVYLGFALAIVLSAYLFSGSNAPYAQIPAYSRLRGVPQRMAEFHAMMFKANAIAQLAGPSQHGSSFKQVVKVWGNYVAHDKKYLSENNFNAASIIHRFMKEYLRVKALGGLKKQLFFAKAFKILKFRNMQNFVRGDKVGAQGDQLKFWKNVHFGLKRFETPVWMNDKGEVLQNHNAQVVRPKTNPKAYWKGAWGAEPLKDVHGNMRFTKHNAAAQLFNRNTESLAFNFHGAMVGKYAPLKYLQIFESARLGNRLDVDDTQFAHAVEKLIKSWNKYLDMGRVKKIQKAFNL